MEAPGMRKDEPDRLFLYGQRADIAYVLFWLCKQPDEDCYASKILRNMTRRQPTMGTVLDALHAFEEAGLITTIEAAESDNRVNQVALTDRGEDILRKLVDFMHAIDGVTGEVIHGPPLDALEYG